MLLDSFMGAPVVTMFWQAVICKKHEEIIHKVLLSGLNGISGFEKKELAGLDRVNNQSLCGQIISIELN